MQIQTPTRSYTPEEYLELEDRAEEKHEYCDGEIVPMAGGTANHNKIALNFASRLNLVLEDEDGEIYIGDVKLWISQARQFAYPDVMVIRGQPIYYDSNMTTVTNPCLIVEVLSKSTRNYDRGDKFDYYRSIPEFQEYILIDQYRYYVQQFAKNIEGKWVLQDWEGEGAVLSLETFDFQISFRQLYQRVNFAEN